MQEALQLKKIINNSSRILVVGKSNKFLSLIKNNIEFTIDNLGDLYILQSLAEEKNITAKIHIKINSGMNRLGVKNIAEFKKMLKIINCSKHIELCGIFTHLYDSNESNNKTQEQILKFSKYVAIVKNENILVHVGGSYALCNKLPKFINMIRCGFFIYGYGSNILTPIMQIKSRVVKITNVHKGQNVGYGKMILKKYRQIALIPIGYADGIPRNLSNKAYVQINNKKCKIIGKICMDMLMVDVTNKNIIEGDEVIVFSDANYFAKKSNTSPYEILTNFTKARTRTEIIDQ